MVTAPKDILVEAKEQRYDFFFYGTLCVPAILIRVLGHKCQGLTFQDALLRDYTRHRVKDDTYPAIISKEQTSKIAPQSNDLKDEAFSVRGTLARGLSYPDVLALDRFEGTEYSRRKVSVETLSQPALIGELPKQLSDPSSRPDVNGDADVSIGESAEAWTYVWSDELDLLVPDIWTFEQFIQAKSSDWNNIPSDWFEAREEALQTQPGVDANRGSDGAAKSTPPGPSHLGDGDEGKIEGIKVDNFPEFGHNMLKYWQFKKDYVNLNHGSYGSPPVPVLEAMRALSKQCEESPDRFMRRAWLPLLNQARQGVADIIHARHEEVVLVPNTTHGVNTILSNLTWEDGDIIIIYSTTYGAVGQTVKYLADRYPKIRIEIITHTFPTSHASIVKETEDLIGKYNQVAIPNYSGQSPPTGRSADERVKLVLVDAIASMPGVVYPWEEIVGVCKKYGVLSLVDAAHAIGQVAVDLRQADCDFWVSNCHKWLMSHRGGAVMYVPLRNQHLVRSSFPTSAGYESARYPTQGIDRPWSFVKQFDWTGTMDWAPFLTISDAIQFRKDIGGEERIMRYCHTLALEGGKRVATKWGTELMETPAGELTGAMANVRLPHIPPPKDLDDQFKQLKYLEDGMFEANCFAAASVHAGVWWVRLSAQVWLEMADFEYVADVLERICSEIEDGKHLDTRTKAEGQDKLEEPQDLPTADDI